MLSSQLTQIVSKVLDVPEAELTPETGMGDVEAWDSLGHLRLMMELEQEFHVRFSTGQLRELITLGEIQRALHIEEPR